MVLTCLGTLDWSWWFESKIRNHIQCMKEGEKDRWFEIYQTIHHIKSTDKMADKKSMGWTVQLPCNSPCFTFLYIFDGKKSPWNKHSTSSGLMSISRCSWWCSGNKSSVFKTSQIMKLPGAMKSSMFKAVYIADSFMNCTLAHTFYECQ